MKCGKFGQKNGWRRRRRRRRRRMRRKEEDPAQEGSRVESIPRT